MGALVAVLMGVPMRVLTAALMGQLIRELTGF